MSIINVYENKIIFISIVCRLFLTSQQAFAMGRRKPVEPIPAPSTKYKEGDIIFIQSQTQEAEALRESTGSVWTHVGLLIQRSGKWVVVEAIGPLKEIPLADFIARSKNKSYRVVRYKH